MKRKRLSNRKLEQVPEVFPRHSVSFKMPRNNDSARLAANLGGHELNWGTRG